MRELENKVFVVGGAVRDLMLGRDPKDLDFVVVGSTPEEMLSLGFNQVGADFPVFLHPETGDEYALARTERKSGKGYHGFTVDFSPSVTLKDDLFRRDLTINAMAIPVESWEDAKNGDMLALYDPFEGLIDLQNKTIRHVSEHFRDDPVRLLRVCRFVARYNFQVNNNTLLLMQDMVNNGEIDHLTSERVWLEFSKSLSEPYFIKFLYTLRIVGALDVLFPELVEMWELVAKGLECTYVTLTDEERFAMLFVHCVPSEVTTFADRLKISNEFHHLAKVVSETWPLINSWDRKDVQETFELIQKFGAFKQTQDLFSVTMIANALGDMSLVQMLSWLSDVANITRKVTFSDLSSHQQETLKGAQIGEAINRLRKEAIHNRLIQLWREEIETSIH